MKARVMETVHGGNACCLAPVVDESTIASGYQEQALNVVSRVSGEVILEVGDCCGDGKVANPES